MTEGIIKYIVRDNTHSFLKGVFSGIGLKTYSQKEINDAFIRRQMNLVKENSSSINSYFNNVAKFMSISIERYEQTQTQ